jgi:SAM-dependent methyltransferase
MATSGPIVELGCGGGRILAALGADGRPLFGVDTDEAALHLARERLPDAEWIKENLLTWTPPVALRHGAGLVIVGGDLLPLFTELVDLEQLFRQGAALLAPSGLFGVDATLIDPQLLNEATGDQDWAEDVRWSSTELGAVRRESRLFPDPKGRRNCALLQIRHWREGDAAPDLRAPFLIRAWLPAEVEQVARSVGLEVQRRGSADTLRWLLRSRHV